MTTDEKPEEPAVLKPTRAAITARHRIVRLFTLLLFFPLFYFAFVQPLMIRTALEAFPITCPLLGENLVKTVNSTGLSTTTKDTLYRLGVKKGASEYAKTIPTESCNFEYFSAETKLAPAEAAKVIVKNGWEVTSPVNAKILTASKTVDGTVWVLQYAQETSPSGVHSFVLRTAT